MPDVAAANVGYTLVAVVVSLDMVKPAPLDAAHLMPVAVVESAVKTYVSVPTACRTLSVPLLTIKSPLVVTGDNASKAATAVV